MPITPQENKQLLSLLSSSFQSRLDDAHPPVRPKGSAPQIVDNSSARATIDHLESLLQHPLLLQAQMHQTKSQPAAARAATMMDQAMLCGKADLEMLNKCMQVYNRMLQDGNTAIKDEFRLGRKISAWFTSTDVATKQRFLSSPSTLRNAVPILYADGLEEVVWQWLEMLYSCEIGVSNPQQQKVSQNTTKPVQWVLQECHLTFLMIKEALRRRRLSVAVLQLIQACAYMQETGRMCTEARSSQPWQAAARAVTIAILQRRHQHGLSTQLFDRFLENRLSWSAPDTLMFELLSVYHPIRPSAKKLIIALGQTSSQAQAHFGQIKVMSWPAQKIMLNALLDGAQLLLEHDSSSVRQAQLILDLVEKHFPTLAGVVGRTETSQQRTQSAEQTINPEEFLAAPIGVT